VILGIETSCDETAAAIARDERTVLSDVVWSQAEMHARFGGVVPELAGRCHIQAIDRVVREALSRAGLDVHDLTAVAVTGGPGLIGALLVGVAYGKALAYARGIPLIPVNHLEGHLSAACVHPTPLCPPFVALIASGGHTNLYHVKAWDAPQLLGRTLDDAAGEAFDKAAKMLGLGYPGGPIIDGLAQSGDPERVPFPRPYPTCSDLNFSFSGIKTALLYYLRDLEAAGKARHNPDIAAGFQQAIVEVLVKKTLAAAERVEVRDIVVTGGVAANSKLRTVFEVESRRAGVRVHIPTLRYCTDNGAMIALAGARLLARGRSADLDFEPRADWAIGVDISVPI
jgi:N6-L-threonylcarbamoyladenine synthase